MDGVSKADAAFLTRLFGPRLTEASGLLPATTPAKAVDWTGPHSEDAIDVLLRSVIHDGIGGAVFGWSLQRVDDRSTLSVHRLKALAVAA